MAVSQIDICNRALSKIGAQRITSIDDDNKQARAVKSCYSFLLESEIRAHRWSFALKRVKLNKLNDAPAWGYSYQYPWPADCLRIDSIDGVFVVQNMDEYRGDGVAPFQIEGRLILTNTDAPLPVRYLALITDTSYFDSCFSDAFACRIAMEICEEITQSNGKKESLRADYKEAISRARKMSAIENPPGYRPDDSWLVGRI